MRRVTVGLIWLSITQFTSVVFERVVFIKL
jgi:hypothetical protein